MGHLEGMVIKDRKEKEAMLVQEASLVTHEMVFQVPQVLLGLLEKKEEMEDLVPQDVQVYLGKKERLVVDVNTAHLELVVRRETVEMTEFLGSQGQGGHPGREEHLERLGLMDFLDLLGRRGELVSQDDPDNLDNKVKREILLLSQRT